MPSKESCEEVTKFHSPCQVWTLSHRPPSAVLGRLSLLLPRLGQNICLWITPSDYKHTRFRNILLGNDDAPLYRSQLFMVLLHFIVHRPRSHSLKGSIACRPKSFCPCAAIGTSIFTTVAPYWLAILIHPFYWENFKRK